MDYQRIHDSIILNAKRKNRKKLKKTNKDYVYYENHHIIPRCMGGTNDKENLVLLTAKEHYMIHKLLTIIYPSNRSFGYTLIRMMYGNGFDKKMRFSSKEYAYAKELRGKQGMSEEAKQKMSKAKRQMSDETKQKMSNSRKGKPLNLNEEQKKNRRKPKSEEHKHHMRKPFTEERKQKLKKRVVSEETKQKLSVAGSGRIVSEETKQKLRKPRSEKAKENMRKPKKVVTCPHCGKSGGSNIMKRYHFDNCKDNPDKTTVSE